MLSHRVSRFFTHLDTTTTAVAMTTACLVASLSSLSSWCFVIRSLSLESTSRVASACPLWPMARCHFPLHGDSCGLRCMNLGNNYSRLPLPRLCDFPFRLLDFSLIPCSCFISVPNVSDSRALSDCPSSRRPPIPSKYTFEADVRAGWQIFI